MFPDKWFLLSCVVIQHWSYVWQIVVFRSGCNSIFQSSCSAARVLAASSFSGKMSLPALSLGWPWFKWLTGINRRRQKWCYKSSTAGPEKVMQCPPGSHGTFILQMLPQGVPPLTTQPPCWAKSKLHSKTMHSTCSP